jgi:tetratricopeptide (TPR) repeat protein
VLITSQFSDWSELAEEVALDVFALEEAVALLRSRTGRGYAGAQSLAEALGCLPLALDHAAAYCKRTQMRFADYATKAWSLIDAAPRGVGYPRSVAATFNLAIAQAVAQCPAAEALIAYLAQCAPERIPMTLVEGAIDTEAMRLEALAVLVEVSLVKHDPFEDGIHAVTVHRLVQAVARARAEENGTWQGAVKRMIGRLLEVYPTDGLHHSQSWTFCARLLPHLLALRNAADQGNWEKAEWCAPLLNRAGSYLQGRAYYAQAVMLYRDARAICENELGPEHLLTAQSLNDLGLALQELGDLPEARLLLERALAIFERELGPDDLMLASCLNNLAKVLQAVNDFSGASSQLERALTIREKSLGPDHYETVTMLHNLAHLRMQKGDLAGARPLFERTLMVYEATLGPEHQWTAKSLTSLARVLQAQGDLAAARPLLERALRINEKVFGRHPTTASSLDTLARLLRDQGDFSKARALVERALAIREEILGHEHPATGGSVHALGLLLADEGDSARALAHFERALTVAEKALGPQHPDTMKVIRSLSEALDALGRTEDAKALRERYGVTS